MQLLHQYKRKLLRVAKIQQRHLLPVRRLPHLPPFSPPQIWGLPTFIAGMKVISLKRGCPSLLSTSFFFFLSVLGAYHALLMWPKMASSWCTEILFCRPANKLEVEQKANIASNFKLCDCWSCCFHCVTLRCPKLSSLNSYIPSQPPYI